MAQINLLPWREQARLADKKRFAMTILGTIIFAVLLVGLLHLYFKNRINNQKARNNYLQMQLNQEGGVLTSINRKKKDLAIIDEQLDFIISLREKSYQIVNMLDELVRVMPDGVSLTKITREQNDMRIFGRAKTNAQVTLLMENIAKKPIFHDSELAEITAKESTISEDRYFQVLVKMPGNVNEKTQP